MIYDPSLEGIWFCYDIPHLASRFSLIFQHLDTMSNVAMVGDDFQLPCNISGEHRDDTIILIIWFRNDSVKPIYTVDARSSDLDHAIHSVDSSIASRVRFILDFPISYLEIKSIIPEDEAEYRCRIDYRISRTIYRSMSLHIRGE